MGMGRRGGRGELGAPWGVTSLPPASRGDTPDLAGREGGCLLGRGFLKYFKKGSIPGNAEASSPLECRECQRGCDGFSSDFFLHSAEFLCFCTAEPQAEAFGERRNGGTSGGPPPLALGPHRVASCKRQPGCSRKAT